jgi:hypothetical protein
MSQRPAHAAEFGMGPWVKGYTDIFGGVIPSQSGFYFRGDAYHYNGSVDTTIFDGRVALGVDQDYTATLMALTYVTPWKILGGTYALAVVPSVVAMDIRGPSGRRGWDGAHDRRPLRRLPVLSPQGQAGVRL